MTARRLMRWCLAVAVAVAGVLAPAAAEATPTCTPPARLLQWPLPSPVWEFCMLTPSHSSGSDGSGIDLYDIQYNGHLVMKRAHAPILNVKYAPGGCGGAGLCYRDWSDEEVRFEAINETGPVTAGPGAYVETVVPARTVCDVGGGVDLGNFRGVAAQRLASQFILTTQTEAGWYRYTMRWTFALDGSFYGWFGFSATTHPCVMVDHTHHNYWRLDFDIDGFRGDSVQVGPPAGIPVPPGPVRMLGREDKKLQDPGTTWIVRDQQTGRGYRLLPGPTVAADSFAVSDHWFLQYNANEITDVGEPGPACAIKFDRYVNQQRVEEDDVVFWVRGGQFHDGGDLDDCHSTWFTFVPLGDWSPTP